MPSDASAIKFAYSIQNLLYNYYKSVPVNTTFFDKLPMGTTTSHLDNMTMSANVVTNLQGLQNQAMLGVQALSDFGSMASSWVVPSCTYTYPPVTNASSHIVNAYYIEASLCGAFIGLADYVQTPTAAFLMARLAAEHGIHASFLGSYMNAAPFSATNTMLTPAFTPESLLRVGSELCTSAVGAMQWDGGDWRFECDAGERWGDGADDNRYRENIKDSEWCAKYDKFVGAAAVYWWSGEEGLQSFGWELCVRCNVDLRSVNFGWDYNYFGVLRIISLIG
ncbi:hypothetical protein LTR39_003734, partial [Cryomyces antarcticus]